jgi:thiol-disulfide isomerase/thioredoxin
MSESSISTSVNTQLTSFFSSSPQEFYSWFTFNMKLIVFLVVIFVLVSLVFFPASLDYDIMYNNINGLKKFTSGCPHCRRMNCTCNEDVVRRQGRGCRGSDITMQEIIVRPILTDVVQEMPKEMQREMQREIQREMTVPAVLKQQPNEPLKEQFSNDDMMSYSYERTSNHQSIPLLALFDENNNPKNLFFGKADRYIFAKDSKLNYRLEIYSNLLVLNGNVYDKSKNVTQSYKVYLINTKTNEKIFLDELKKDGDGMYKLKFNSLDKNKEAKDFIQYDKIQIVHSLDSSEDILLEGKFN